MKLDKSNCDASCYDDGTAFIKNAYWRVDFTKVKVFEIPKVWRENGKQYKVTDAYIDLEGGDYHLFTVKAPKGCKVHSIVLATIEYYD